VTSSGALRRGEGIAQIVLPYAIPVGTVLSKNNFSKVEGRINFGSTADQLTVFSGTIEVPTYLCALHSSQSGGEMAWNADATDDSTTAVPPGLKHGETAVAIPRVKRSSVYNLVITNSVLLPRPGEGPAKGKPDMLRPMSNDPKFWSEDRDYAWPTAERFQIMTKTSAPLWIWCLSWGPVVIIGVCHMTKTTDLSFLWSKKYLSVAKKDN